MSDPVRIITKVRNNRLMEARERLGLSARQFAGKAGIGYNHYNSIENLSLIPSEVTADKISIAAGVPAEILFPAYLGSIKTNTLIRTIPEEALLSLADPECLMLPAPADMQDDRMDAEKLIKEALKKLTAREQLVIEKRFGLNNQSSLTLNEIAEQMGVRRARVGQIEEKALRKLRRPGRSNLLRGLFGFH